MSIPNRYLFARRDFVRTADRHHAAGTRRKLSKRLPNEMMRLIKEVDPPKPSTRLSSSESLPSIAAQRSIEPHHYNP